MAEVRSKSDTAMMRFPRSRPSRDFGYHPAMPLIVCAKCGRNYDVPGAVAVRLPTSIATCACGEWLSGSKAALLARLLNPEEIREVDMKQYEVDPRLAQHASTQPIESDPFDLSAPRSMRVVARGAGGSINQIFTIHEHPLWIGRAGCHVELDDADLSIRHCSISVQGAHLVLRDADSYTGTFLDGQPVTETAIDDGIHLLRVGSALVTLEPVSDPGTAVDPIRLEAGALETSSLLFRKLQEKARNESAGPKRQWLVCIEGALSGQEFEIPPLGLVVGREGDVRVPDEYLSRKHFEVMPNADGLVHVRDLGSRNGTFLNTLPARNTRVHAGDEIRAGVNRFRVEERDGA